MDPSSTPNQQDTLTAPLKELAGRNWATLRQCSNILGHTYQTILKYIKEGPNGEPPRLKAVRVGGQWRVYEDELRRFLTEGNNPTTKLK